MGPQGPCLGTSRGHTAAGGVSIVTAQVHTNPGRRQHSSPGSADATSSSVVPPAEAPAPVQRCGEEPPEIGDNGTD